MSYRIAHSLVPRRGQTGRCTLPFALLRTEMMQVSPPLFLPGISFAPNNQTSIRESADARRAAMRKNWLRLTLD